MAQPKFHVAKSKFVVSCFFCAGPIGPGDRFVARGSIAICDTCTGQITTLHYQIRNG